MGRAYYNELDKYAAQWLRNLIQKGLIAPGDVDERSIRDVQPADLDGYTQCHFFAGIGGWSLALRLAGISDDAPIWTGSCPCQPFSVAGKMRGFADDRDLWPEFYRLIRERRPSVLLGEQTAKAPAWLGRLRSDLEAVDYAVGCMPIEAASAGADHFRDRYWFVADRLGIGVRGARYPDVIRTSQETQGGAQERERLWPHAGPDDTNVHSPLADNDLERTGPGLQRSGELSGPGHDTQDSPGALADVHGQRSQISFSESRDIGAECAPAARGDLCAVVDLARIGWGEGFTESEFRSRGFTAAVASIHGCQFVECPDGKWRRLPPPGVRWLGTRIPARVAKLRAIGNAIDCRPAAEFISAYLEARWLPPRS